MCLLIPDMDKALGILVHLASSVTVSWDHDTSHGWKEIEFRQRWEVVRDHGGDLRGCGKTQRWSW